MRIILVDGKGREHELEAVEGWRVMEIIRDWGLPMEGTCGGACDCATCHVIVAPQWADRLFPPREEELDKLDELPLIEPTSRLSCQILYSPELDGLEVTLAPET